MPLDLVLIWQVVSEVSACEGSKYSILTNWHVSPSYQGWDYSSLVTASSLVILSLTAWVVMQNLFVTVHCQDSPTDTSL